MILEGNLAIELQERDERTGGSRIVSIDASETDEREENDRDWRIHWLFAPNHCASTAR